MGGEGKPVAAHCTPEQKQIAACQKLRATIELLGMQAQRNLWNAINPRAGQVLWLGSQGRQEARVLCNMAVGHRTIAEPA